MPETCIMPEHTVRPKMNKEPIPIYLDPLMKPLSRLPDIKTQDDRKVNLDLVLDINKDFEENSPYQEGIISKMFKEQPNPNY